MLTVSEGYSPSCRLNTVQHSIVAHWSCAWQCGDDQPVNLQGYGRHILITVELSHKPDFPPLHSSPTWLAQDWCPLIYRNLYREHFAFCLAIYMSWVVCNFEYSMVRPFRRQGRAMYWWGHCTARARGSARRMTHLLLTFLRLLALFAWPRRSRASSG